MKISLYMAISANGFITKGKSNYDWVSEEDWDQFYSYIKKNDAVIMGRKTMEQFGEIEFPIKKVFNIVLSANKKLHKNTKDLVIMKGTPQNIVSFANIKGFEKLLIIGGENINGQFLKANLVNEIVLSVHPIIIKKGLTLFGKNIKGVRLNLINSKNINNELVQIRYKVIN